MSDRPIDQNSSRRFQRTTKPGAVHSLPLISKVSIPSGHEFLGHEFLLWSRIPPRLVTNSSWSRIPPEACLTFGLHFNPCLVPVPEVPRIASGTPQWEATRRRSVVGVRRHCAPLMFQEGRIIAMRAASRPAAVLTGRVCHSSGSGVAINTLTGLPACSVCALTRALVFWPSRS